MNDAESLKHTRRECKYPIVFIPKRRKKLIYVQLRKELGTIFRVRIGGISAVYDPGPPRNRPGF